MGTCSGSFPGSKVGRFETGRENNCLPCKRHLTKFQQGFPIQSFPIRNLKPRLVPRPTIISSDWRGETKTPAAPLPPFGKLRSISIFISQFKILFCFAYYTFKPTGVSIVFRGRELYYHCFFWWKKTFLLYRHNCLLHDVSIRHYGRPFAAPFDRCSSWMHRCTVSLNRIIRDLKPTVSGEVKSGYVGHFFVSDR